MKRIGLVETGGTIGSRSSKTGCQLGERRLVDEAGFLRRSPVRIFSEDAGPSDWIKIARAVKELDREGVESCLVLHGTDTMAWTAAFLSYALQDLSFPVILTGSMIPGHDPGSDAPGNIADALLAAEGLPAGVYVVFSGQLFSGSRVRKSWAASRQGPFIAPAASPLAEIKDGNLCLRREVPQPRRVALPIAWQPVRWIRMFPGQTLPEGRVEEGSILLELYQSATAPQGLARFLDENRDRQIFSVTPDGRPFQHLYPSGEFLGQTTPLTITPESAYVKIGWAASSDDQVGLVSRDLCGETVTF